MMWQHHLEVFISLHLLKCDQRGLAWQFNIQQQMAGQSFLDSIEFNGYMTMIVFFANECTRCVLSCTNTPSPLGSGGEEDADTCTSLMNLHVKI